MELYKYEGCFYDSEEQCWLALLGGAEYTRYQLKLTIYACDMSEAQMVEIHKALAELPSDGTKPKRSQRRKPTPAEGQLDG